jgi:enoyl-CoA hydratase/carnithine racemase
MTEDAEKFTGHGLPEPLLLRQERGPIALLTLNRPQSRNSLSEQLLKDLLETFGEHSASQTMQVVTIAGAPPAFCAGHDLRELTARRQDEDRGRAFFEHLMRLCSDVMLSIMACPKPVIAAVNGIAMAAGCQLVASCDLAIAGQNARFATPGVNIGLFCSTPMVALSRNVGRKQAMEMLLLGDMISAQKAAAIGLVNRIAAADDALPAALEMAADIASKSPMILKIGKEAFYRQLEMPVSDGYDYASRVMVENMLHRDAEEGIGAFLDKRAPHWGGSD